MCRNQKTHKAVVLCRLFAQWLYVRRYKHKITKFMRQRFYLFIQCKRQQKAKAAQKYQKSKEKHSESVWGWRRKKNVKGNHIKNYCKKWRRESLISYPNIHPESILYCLFTFCAVCAVYTQENFLISIWYFYSSLYSFWCSLGDSIFCIT